MRYIQGREYLTPREAAAALGLTRAQVYALIERRTLKATRVAYALYLARPDVERYRSVLDDGSAEALAARLLRAVGVRQRLILSSRN